VILPYVLRLLCLCLASFYLLHLVLAAAVSGLAPLAIRIAGQLRPRMAARFLLTLRLLPAGVAAFLVAGMCAPSYLLLEPDATAEDVGLTCLLAAVLGGAIWAIAMARGLRASIRSMMYVRQCERTGAQTYLAGDATPVLVVPGTGASLALAGVFRPRLVISQPVVSALSTEQLAAALRHERAHQTSRDNFKRLVILLTPRGFPFAGGFASLESAWAKFTEWAADDRAVAANGLRSVSLAAALVRVARLGPSPQPSLLMTSLLADGRELSTRVERLLVATPPGEALERDRPVMGVIATAIAAVPLVFLMLQPGSLWFAHRLLEHLIH
jgi:Zn-dependent protease with chaperone function